MKIAIFSDSHGYIGGMVRAVEENTPDLILHLGDHSRDAHTLSSFFPDIPIKNVCGNCDFPAGAPATETFTVNGICIFMTHGHKYSVKSDLTAFLNAAHFSGAQLALFGHTHIPFIKSFGSLTALNPGSCGNGASPSFALAEISESGVFSCQTLTL